MTRSSADDFKFQVRLSSVYQRVSDLQTWAPEHPVQLPDVWVDGSSVPLARRVLVGLVLDGILEMKWGGGSGTGLAALPLYADWAPPAPVGTLAEISIRAVRLAERIDTTSPVELSRWLYDFGRTPPRRAEVRSGRWGHRLLTTIHQTRLESVYSHQSGKWDVWGHTSSRQEPSAPRHKLYISPRIHSLDAVLRETIELLLSSPVPAFKITPTRAGAARPDKLIIYFHSLSRLERWAYLLADRIKQHKAHGVPFTRQLDRTGLLSRAVDPKTESDAKEESWRSWCTDRLGWALAIARLSKPDTSPLPAWRFALFRLAVDGVDVSRWRLLGEEQK